jgi:hypothetical protein
MHLSDFEYNQYADDQDDQDLDEGAVNPQFINAQVTKILAGEARRMTNAPMAQLLAPVMREYGLTLQQIDAMVPGGLRKAAGEYGIMMKEGSWGGSGPGGLKAHYAVYKKENGKVSKVKDTNKAGGLMNPREAEAYAAIMIKNNPGRYNHDNVWTADADIDLNEAGSPAQQAAIAIAMKRAGKKPKSVDENTVQIPHKGKMVSGKVVRKDPVSGEYIVDVGEYGSVRVPAHKVKHDVEETTAFLTRGPRLSYGDQTQHATLGPVQVEKVMPDGSVVVYCERDGKRYRTSPSALKSAVAENQDTSAVESAIIRRIMVSHTDLLQQFGPDKVMQAAEEVAYNVGDVDEIGTSDVSAWVNEVKQILGAE